MSAVTVYAGLRERFATVAGLENIILGEPTAVHKLPCLSTGFARIERSAEGSPPSNSSITIVTYFWTHRLFVAWQDQQQAEAELISFVNSIPASVAADPHLGGRITSGGATMPEGNAGFVTIAGTLFRIIDFTSKVIEKADRSSNL